MTEFDVGTDSSIEIDRCSTFLKRIGSLNILTKVPFDNLKYSDNKLDFKQAMRLRFRWRCHNPSISTAVPSISRFAIELSHCAPSTCVQTSVDVYLGG